MRSTLLIIAFLYIQGVGAQDFPDRIHSIERGENGAPHLVKFRSGAVQFVEQDEASKLKEFEERHKLDKASAPVTKMRPFQDPGFEPTLVSDATIQEIFSRFNPYMRRKSECSDRAHVWAWDEFQRSGTKSEKAFLMLTDAYIRRNRYRWFHVAPMFTTTSGAKIVMDYQFLDRPVTFTEWKNLIVFSQRECVADFRFLDYDAGADQGEDCYVKFEPMYYYIPGDIGAREMGSPKTGWNVGQVNASRSRAFFKGSVQ